MHVECQVLLRRVYELQFYSVLLAVQCVLDVTPGVPHHIARGREHLRRTGKVVLPKQDVKIIERPKRNVFVYVHCENRPFERYDLDAIRLKQREQPQ